MFPQNLALFALASLCATTGSVRLVDALSGPYFDIQSAVDASVAGDVVLVRTGTYTSFAVIGRDLAVVADTGASVQLQGSVRVRDVAAGQTLLVSGLHARAIVTTPADTSGLDAMSCTGSIRIQDCEFTGEDGPFCVVAPPIGMPPGVRIQTCNDVAIARSSLLGGRMPGGFWNAQPTDAGGPGIDVGASRVALQQVVARGPAGGHGNSTCPDGSSGGTGVVVRPGSELDAQSCTFEGGIGGSAFVIGPFAYGGDGGSGLVLLAACPTQSVARTLATTLRAGTGGDGHCVMFCGGQSLDGSPGMSSSVGACASIVPILGVPPALDCIPVVREGTALVVAVTGAPGDRVWLRIARATGHAWNQARNGVNLLEGGLARWLLAAQIGPSGQGTCTLPIPMLPVGDQARVFHMQVQAERPNGSLQLGSARSVVIVDSAF